MILLNTLDVQLLTPGFHFSKTICETTLFPLCPSFNRSEVNDSSSVVQPSSSCNYCRGKHSTDGRFYNFSTLRIRYYAYSAFYDDRPSLLSSPVIRIIAITDNVGHVPNAKLHCILYHSGGTKRVVMETNPKGCGPGYPFNGRGADPYVYTCPTEGIVPHSLSVVGMGSDHVSSCMPVEFPLKPKLQKDFVVCVPVSYGNINPYRIIEWLEIQKIMGVNLIRVYDLYLSEPALKVLRHYQQEGFVQVRKMDRPYPHEPPKHILELAISLNDCLYRHMYEFKRTVTNDFDEFIKPLKHDNLQQLIGYLEGSSEFNQSTNYIFRNTYFFLEVPPDANMSSRFTILRYRKKASVSEMRHRVKPIILTMSCTHVYSHLCLGATANYSSREPVLSVPPELAVTQHYRACPLGGPACKAAMNTTKQDDTLLAYKDRITDALRTKAIAIMGNTSVDF